MISEPGSLEAGEEVRASAVVEPKYEGRASVFEGVAGCEACGKSWRVVGQSVWCGDGERSSSSIGEDR